MEDSYVQKARKADEKELAYQNRKWSSMLKTKRDAPPPEGKNVISDCFIWTNTPNDYGYGQCDYRKGTKKVHLISWMIHHSVSEIPRLSDTGDRLVVRHLCDVKMCFQPLHLKLGTCYENSQDAINSNVLPRGEKCKSAVLTDAIVQEIRATMRNGETKAVRMARYGISRKCLYDVEHYISWSHVPDLDGTLHGRAAIEARNETRRKRKKVNKEAVWTQQQIDEAKALFTDPKRVKYSEDVFYNRTPCLVWLGLKDKHGYGKVDIHGQKQWQTHRLNLTLKEGMVIQPKHIVCRHLCENTSCCNTDHLAFGTFQDNAHDKAKSDGWSNAKLDDKQVTEMRRKYATSNMSFTDLGLEYEISKSRAREIVLREGYSHIERDEYDDIITKKLEQGYLKRKLTKDQVREIRKKHDNGERVRSLAAEYNIAEGAIYQIVKHITYLDVKDVDDIESEDESGNKKRKLENEVDE